MKISYRDLRNHKVLALKGEFDHFSIIELKDALFTLIHEKGKSIILDFKDVYSIDSAGIGFLVGANKESDKYDGKLALLNVSDDVLDLLELATVERIIKIYDDEDEIP